MASLYRSLGKLGLIKTSLQWDVILFVRARALIGL